MLTMADVDQMDRTSFVAQFGAIYEHSPWVAERACEQRPFGSLERMHAAMVEAVEAATPEEQLALIRAHPDLAGRVARAGSLTQDSAKEQAQAGLDRLTDAEFARFHMLNDAYKAKFGFPFILAVRGAGKEQILASFEARLPNELEKERRTALEQIARIARFRLHDMVQG